MKKNSLTSIILTGVLALLTYGVRIWMWLNANALIIHHGVRGYRSFGRIVNIVVLVATVLLLGNVAWFVAKNRKKQKTNAVPKQEGMLAGRLSDSYIMGEVVKQGQGKWQCLSEETDNIAKQLSLMNSYQDRLSRLLTNNSAKAMSDAEGILDRIEQEILSNVKQVLNYMEILGVDDKLEVQQYIAVCMQDNRKLLDATKDFLVCLTQFLNGRGTHGNNLEMVEKYKKILVESLGSARNKANDTATMRIGGMN